MRTENSSGEAKGEAVSSELADAAEEMFQRLASLLEDHEKREHEGRRCPDERAGIIAYLAHKLGADDALTLGLIIEGALEYRRSHCEREKGDPCPS